MAPHGYRTARTERGFTTVDLLVAMAVAGLMLAATVNNLNHVVPRMRVKQAAIDLAGAIRGARARAIQDHESVIMPVDVDGGRYVIVTRSGPERTTTVTIDGDRRRVAQLPTGVRFVAPKALGKSITPVRIGEDADEPQVLFNARGRLLGELMPGTIYLGNPSYDAYWKLDVDLAGNVKLSRWDGSKWA